MRRSRTGGRAAALLLLLALSACSTVPPGALDRTIVGQTIEGRMSVRYKDLQTQKEDALSGRFVWTASGEDLELSLLDPFGQTVALIRSGSAGSSITFRDGRRIDGVTPEALTQRTLGWTVPLSGLRSWLDGKPDPGRPAERGVGLFRQDGWTVRFPVDDTKPLEPPKRIDLSYPGPPAEVEMRLVVDQRGDR